MTIPSLNEFLNPFGRSRGFCEGFVPCCQEPGWPLEELLPRASSWKRRGVEFQQWGHFPAMENPREETSSLLAPTANAVVVGKISGISSASPRKLPSKELPSPCLSLQPHVSSLGGIPWGAPTGVPDLGNSRSWQTSRDRLCVSPCSWATCTRKGALGSTGICSQHQKGEVYTGNFRLCIGCGLLGCESLGPGLVKLRGAVPSSLLTGHSQPPRWQDREGCSCSVPEQGNRAELGRFQDSSAALVQRLTGPGNALSPAWTGLLTGSSIYNSAGDNLWLCQHQLLPRICMWIKRGENIYPVQRSWSWQLSGVEQAEGRHFQGHCTHKLSSQTQCCASSEGPGSGHCSSQSHS